MLGCCQVSKCLARPFWTLHEASDGQKKAVPLHGALGGPSSPETTANKLKAVSPYDPETKD